jgi:hypothetical protein
MVVAVLMSLLATVGCGGVTALVPTAPSRSLSAPQAGPSLPPPAVSAPAPHVINGTVEPLDAGGPRCYLELYSCEVYPFALASDGGVDVTLAWEGGDRALMLQLYRADVGLVHEDLAPKGGPSRISFRRPDLASMAYELRVVNLQRDTAIPFELRFTPWEN